MGHKPAIDPVLTRREREILQLVAEGRPFGRFANGILLSRAATFLSRSAPRAGRLLQALGVRVGSSGSVESAFLRIASAVQAYLRLAEGAAWDAWESDQKMGILCCGAAGRGYALLNLYRHTGEAEWRKRAAELAVRAVTGTRAMPQYINSLYQGDVGIALLAVDVERPEEAAMPFFELEGWPASGRGGRTSCTEPTKENGSGATDLGRLLGV